MLRLARIRELWFGFESSVLPVLSSRVANLEHLWGTMISII